MTAQMLLLACSPSAQVSPPTGDTERESKTLVHLCITCAAICAEHLCKRMAANPAAPVASRALLKISLNVICKFGYPFVMVVRTEFARSETRTYE